MCIRDSNGGFANGDSRLGGAGLTGFLSMTDSLSYNGHTPTVFIEGVQMSIASVNPSTGETLKTFQPHSQQQTDQKLQLASETFRTHRRTTFEERSQKMFRVA